VVFGFGAGHGNPEDREEGNGNEHGAFETHRE
jgi:hypothetical protein